jgi:hypothetical protein
MDKDGSSEGQRSVGGARAHAGHICSRRGGARARTGPHGGAPAVEARRCSSSHRCVERREEDAAAREDAERDNGSGQRKMRATEGRVRDK